MIMMIKNLEFKQLHGKELSYNNYNDLFAGLEILQSFKGKAATVVIKHANPCGISINKKPLISFKNAYECDPVSAFGGVIACNYKMNKKIANEITKNFLEVILSKGFDKESLKILKRKKNLRIIDISKFKYKNQMSIKSFDGSFLLQNKNNKIVKKEKLQMCDKIKTKQKRA